MPSYRGISPEVNGGADLGSTTQKWNAVHANHVLTAGSLYRRRTRKAFTLADLAAAVADGDYAARDIDVGDFFVGASGYAYVFAGDNPLKGTYQDYPITVDHAGLVVDTHTKSKWNDTNTTAGGYVASVLHAYLTDTVLPNVKSDLGVEHLIAHKKYYSSSVGTTLYNRNGTNSGAVDNAAWSSGQYISALSEIQICGSIVYSSSGLDIGESFMQLDLFRRFNTMEIFGDEDVWLRTIATAAGVTYLSDGGRLGLNSPSSPYTVAGLIAFH